jgi:hypothetical protein
MKQRARDAAGGFQAENRDLAYSTVWLRKFLGTAQAGG